MNDSNGFERKILLVDDEEGIRKVLGISIADRGYEVLTAANGVEALELFKKFRPSIVLTDIKMPEMDGITLLKRIKEISQDTEVIMFTGHGELDLAIKSLQNEALDFLTKPVNEDILEITLKRAEEKIVMRNQLRTYTKNLEALVEEQAARLVEAERMIAVGQALDGLSDAMKNIATDLEDDLTYLNEMPCLVSIHDRNLKIVGANRLFKERFSGRSKLRSWEIHEGLDKKTCPVALTFATGRGQRKRSLVLTSAAGNLPVIVHTAPIRNREGEIELVIEIAADISEIQKLREELKTSQKRYQELFDTVPCYISVQDEDLIIQSVNRRFIEDFGRMANMPCYTVYKGRKSPCRDCPVLLTFEDGMSHQAEMVITDKNGKKYDVLIWTSPIRDSEGKIISVMEMLTDITQLRSLQDNLSTIGFLMSTLAHDIKSLLTGLDGGMYLIESGLDKGDDSRIEEGRQAVSLIKDRIRNMVQNILLYAKDREPEKEITDVRSFFEDILLMVTPGIRARGVEFKSELDSEEPVSINIDVHSFRSAIISIIENAVEAVLAKEKNTPKILFRVSVKPDEIIFLIKDNGVGMTPEVRENLFRLFFSSKGKSGTGLGLFIANKTVLKHGGRIEVETEPQSGSTFRIIMPRAKRKIRQDIITA